MVRTLLLSILIAVLGILYNITPSVLSPCLWENPNPLRSLDGVLKPNTILQSTTELHSGIYRAAESIAFNKKGEVFGGLADGRVVTFGPGGEFLREVLFVGAFINTSVPAETLRTFCKTELEAKRLYWNPGNERLCGRPLGLRVHDEVLYIADAYHGIFRMELTTGKVEHLISSSTPIVVPSYADPLASKPIMFFNDLDVHADGTIIFSDSSYVHTRSENRKELLDAAPRGRLFEYKKKGNDYQLRPLLCGLHFPNGVQYLSPSHLLVAESARFRILRVNLKSSYFSDNDSSESSVGVHHLASCEERGSLFKALAASDATAPTPVSVFLDSVPGFADNIRPNYFAPKEKPSFYVGLGAKSVKPFSLLWFGYQSIVLRDIIGKFVPMEVVEHLVPRYGLVIEVNSRGEIVSSLHDPTGRIAFVSEAHRNPVTGDMWLGSHSNAFIGMLPSQFIPS